MFLMCRSQSVRQPGRPGAQINYREEEKKILDEILGKGVYDNRIRPSGSNGTGENGRQIPGKDEFVLLILRFFYIYDGHSKLLSAPSNPK
jgi:hypothetical protein